ncbi:hypothetical protein AMJ39_07360 [candidate division TA06 bacterium DG_24]|uniref:Uncharacterized protein n=3 Tax=Bacteria division TA06 TaxID=1156500 RepID=A0A0S8JMK6_UNCT6|nr:MAG: hypothetical protein AMJ39_07360 [candidate division TA06 bacterium DG_24]KPK68664.1 MAG: hypothetical protein AMJ82_07685 [candidate division TA06 bacterium SM23_40]KPL10060.1 MAG: hypothetical protein AMJ71_04550 [candidate division TA06 bacterium SM1_40]
MRYTVISRVICASLAFCQLLLGFASGQSLEYVVGPQDVLRVYIFDHPELSTDAVVSADGYVFLPLVGAVSVGDLTIREVEGVLTEAFGSYIVDPKVTVGLAMETRKRVYVIGQVRRPGAYPYVEGGRLSDYLGQAGGFDGGADIRRTRITRLSSEGWLVYYIDVDRIYEQGRRDLDIEMEADDTVFVPETLASRIRWWLPVVGFGVGIVTTFIVWRARR